MEGEIDLRAYLNVIIRRWKWIVAVTLVAAITAAIVSFFVIAPVYEARAGVLILKSRSEITFEPTYRTLTEEELARASMEIMARREAIQALAESSPVMAEVIAKLGAALDPEEVARLSEMVKTEIRGDLIEIAVRSTDPKKAATIANAWAEAYERYVNELYGGRPQSAEDIEAQVVEARKTYEEAQVALTKFRGDNRIEFLSREIEAKQNALTDYYATKQAIDLLIPDAKALRDHLGGGSSSTGLANDLSIILLKASAFTLLAPDLPAQLQLSLDQGTGIENGTEEQAGDLDTVIAVLEARQEEVEALIDDMSLQREILELQEQLEGEQAKERELGQARDLAWETYQTLARKEVEVGISAQLTDTELHFAIRALEPSLPVAPKKAMNIAIAGVLGLMVSVLAVFGAEYLGNQQGETSSR